MADVEYNPERIRNFSIIAVSIFSQSGDQDDNFDIHLLLTEFFRLNLAH
jgi:hypothetical protein